MSLLKSCRCGSIINVCFLVKVGRGHVGSARVSLSKGMFGSNSCSFSLISEECHSSYHKSAAYCTPNIDSPISDSGRKRFYEQCAFKQNARIDSFISKLDPSEGG